MVAAADNRIVSLDGVRAIATLLVLSAHSESIFFREPMEAVSLHHSPAALFLSSDAAVSMFFILSGYVLARSAARGREWRDVVYFLIRRVFRIHPPYLAALLLAWLAYFAYSPANVDFELSETILKSRSVHLSVDQLMKSALFPGPAFGQLVPGWTLKVEMIYSVALPLMMWVANRSHWSVLLGLTIALMQFGVGEYPVERFGVHFAVGIALNLERVRIARMMDSLPSFVQSMMVVIGLALFVYPEYALLKYDNPRGAVGLFVVGSALLVICAVHTAWLRKALSVRPLKTLGRLSYSVYLLHMPVILLLVPFAREGGTAWQSWILFGIPVAIATCSISWVFERYVDGPSIRAGHRVTARLARARVPSGSA